MKFHRVALLVVGVVLLLLSIGLGIRVNLNGAAAQRDRKLTDQATAKSGVLSEYFDRARTVILLSAQNPAFADFYAAPGTQQEKLAAGGPRVERLNAALAYLETLYPTDTLSEVCFIHGSGAEIARVVGTHVARIDELSPDESGSTFFARTLSVEAGGVYQAAPYVSPDTHQWVISNSTLLPIPGQSALLHFEVSLDSFRSALLDSSGNDTVVMDAKSGAVVIDVRRELNAGGPVLSPEGPDFSALPKGDAGHGLITINGERIAFARTRASVGNENDWLVLAKAPIGNASILRQIGWGPVLILVAGMSVLGFALSSFRSSQRGLRRLALTDSLTGLPNRLRLNEFVGRGIRSAERQGKQAGVIMIDLDRFKEINDTLGHHKGDVVLIEAAHRLKMAVRGNDSVARLGGDEFAVYLGGLSSSADAIGTADRIVRAFGEPFILDGLAMHVGASVGISLYPAHGSDPHTLMQRADVAMYQAKRDRSGFRLYDVESDQHTEHSLLVAAELYAAIAKHELAVHYQPMVDLSSGLLSGVEALVRWNHPELGQIPPSEFIPLAEETGLIRALTLDVLDQACAQSRAWSDVGYDIPIAINFSTRLLADERLVEYVSSALERFGLQGPCLLLELTETAMIADQGRAQASLQALHDMGIRIAIDDFGTGYFSLTGLRHNAVTEIKIDRSFVARMVSDDNDAFIVESTIALGHKLGLHVVAEGVEDEATVAMLSTFGCDTAQGYLYARPMPATEILMWARERTRSITAAASNDRSLQTDKKHDHGAFVGRSLTV